MELETLWWIGGASLVAPYAISYLKAADWEPQRKRLFAIVVSLVLGVAAYTTQNGLSALSFSNFEAMMANGTGVWFLGQIVYEKLIGGTSLEVSAAASPAGVVTLNRRVA